MFKYYITKEEFDTLKKDIKFLTAIRLLRMDNVITTLQSLFYRVLVLNKEDTVSNKRDRLELILYYGAVLYESLKTIYDMKDLLKDLKEYKNHIDDINYLFQEWNNPNSFMKTILAKIRDKLAFHFDEDVFQEAISKIDLPENELTISEAESERSIDVNYTVIPILYFNYLISYVDGYNSDEEKLKHIYGEMDSIAKKLSEVIGNIAGELLIGSVHYKEN